MLDKQTVGLSVSKSETEAPTTKYELISRISQDLARAEANLGWHLSKKETGGAILGDKEAELKGAEMKVESLRKTLDKVIKEVT